jgi:hypothetical protein
MRHAPQKDLAFVCLLVASPCLASPCAFILDTRVYTSTNNFNKEGTVFVRRAPPGRIRQRALLLPVASTPSRTVSCGSSPLPSSFWRLCMRNRISEFAAPSFRAKPTERRGCFRRQLALIQFPIVALVGCAHALLGDASLALQRVQCAPAWPLICHLPPRLSALT